MKPKRDANDIVITLRPAPPGRDVFGRDAYYRLRGLLKVAGRRFGLRCISVKPLWVHREMSKDDQDGTQRSVHAGPQHRGPGDH